MTLVRRIKTVIRRRIPIVQWLPRYSKMRAVSDAVAGITVGLTMMPQSIAYASLAGLSSEYGLYSAFMGSFVYVMFGTVREVSIGPTSLMALLTFAYTQDLPIEFVTLLAFLAGCVELLMGLLNLGFLVGFISAPVMSGFTSATSVIIIVAQIKGIMGVRFKSQNFIDNLRQLYLHLPQTNPYDCLVGISCIIFLLLLRKLKDVKVGPDNVEHQTPSQRRIRKLLWFISISRNAITVLICSFVAYGLSAHGLTPFRLSRKVAPGLPPFGLPPFSTVYNNQTIGFVEMCKELGSATIFVPVVAVLANVAIAKAFSTGAPLDATQEMFTLGLCNIAGSFVKSMPTCGAFTRSAVSNASGARTPLVGLYSGTIILLALSFLTPYFRYIPRATIAAVLIAAVMFMIEFHAIMPLWRSKKWDFCVMVATFFISLMSGVEVGLISGIAIDMAHLLFLWARPTININRHKFSNGDEYLLVSPDMGLYYAAVEYLTAEINTAAMSDGESLLPVVVDFASIKGTDYSTAMGIKILVADFERRRQPLVFMNVRPIVLLTFGGANVEIKHCKNEEEVFDLLYGEKESGKSENLPMLRAKLEMDDLVTSKVDTKIDVPPELPARRFS
ncbi:sodium-independent sulfate anion transporter [Schistocerca serialis cubense]|uniref:sodium-independent sulfate anion transporter n=1 Tax=Schistocerca serialis cubense TaxID=2023355 RepID=UPI00214EAAA1|nr:sodium-independent sulfate anion transporter [Schistocerca serialis cubense]